MARRALLLLTSSRPIRMIAYADYVTTGFVGWMSKVFRVIPIQPHEGPKALLRSLQMPQEAIKNGELVCIFAEGSITRTGQLQPFQRGVMRIVQGTGAPSIPSISMNSGAASSVFAAENISGSGRVAGRILFPLRLVHRSSLRLTSTRFARRCNIWESNRYSCEKIAK